MGILTVAKASSYVVGCKGGDAGGVSRDRAAIGMSEHHCTTANNIIYRF